jgi:hypothetical protein
LTIISTSFSSTFELGISLANFSNTSSIHLQFLVYASITCHRALASNAHNTIHNSSQSFTICSNLALSVNRRAHITLLDGYSSANKSDGSGIASSSKLSNIFSADVKLFTKLANHASDENTYETLSGLIFGLDCLSKYNQNCQ